MLEKCPQRCCSPLPTLPPPGGLLQLHQTCLTLTLKYTHYRWTLFLVQVKCRKSWTKSNPLQHRHCKYPWCSALLGYNYFPFTLRLNLCTKVSLLLTRHLEHRWDGSKSQNLLLSGCYSNQGFISPGSRCDRITDGSKSPMLSLDKRSEILKKVFLHANRQIDQQTCSL